MTAKLIMLPPSLRRGGFARDGRAGRRRVHVWERNARCIACLNARRPREKECFVRLLVSSANHNSEDGWLDCGKEGGKGTEEANKTRKSRAGMAQTDVIEGRE